MLETSLIILITTKCNNDSLQTSPQVSSLQFSFVLLMLHSFSWVHQKNYLNCRFITECTMVHLYRFYIQTAITRGGYIFVLYISHAVVDYTIIQTFTSPSLLLVVFTRSWPDISGHRYGGGWKPCANVCCDSWFVVVTITLLWTGSLVDTSV